MLKRIIALSLLTMLLGMGASAQNATPVVIASHSILADVARQIAGDRLDVRTLIPPGSDPHHFIPTPSDLAAVSEADLVLINGIGYEETLLEAIENAGANVNIVVASACIDVRPAGGHDDHDEHAHEDEDEHMHEDEDDHAHEDEDEHAHEDEDDDHADEDEHAHEDEDDHAHEDEDEHAHEDEDDDHADEDEHAHEDEDEHAHEDELSGCDAQDAEYYAIGFHDHGSFLGRAEDIECAAHEHDDHGDEHDDEHEDEHEDEHADEHDDEHGDEHADEHDDMHADEHGHEEGACDPHIWFDPQNVIRWALTIRDSYAEIDPDHASEYHENALAYAAELDALEMEFIWPALENLPVEKRLLVTAHDALGYLAGTFQFEIVSTVIPGVSTVVEPSASDVAAVIDVIREHDLRAIFGESITSDKILQVIAAETGVDIAPLYTDSLSQADGPAATYLEYMRYNFTTIVEALGG